MLNLQTRNHTDVKLREKEVETMNTPQLRNTAYCRLVNPNVKVIGDPSK
jgi:hypothetical protein